MSTVTSEVIIYVNIICASDRNRCESRQPDYRDECKPSRSETFPDAKSDHRRNHRRVCISLHPGRPIDYWKFSRIYQYCRLPDYDILRALLSLAVPRFRQCSGNLRKSGPKRHFLPKRRAGRQLHSPFLQCRRYEPVTSVDRRILNDLFLPQHVDQRAYGTAAPALPFLLPPGSGFRDPADSHRSR